MSTPGEGPRTFAVLPAKSPAVAMSRLAPLLGREDRGRLMLAMLEDVLEVLTGCRAIEAVVLVTPDPRCAALGGAAGAVVVDERGTADHSRAALAGVSRWLAAHGHEGPWRALLVPGDCPALDRDEVLGLLEGDAGGGDGGERSAGGTLTIVADRHGSGTNALMCEPAAAVVPRFGPGSLARHAAAAAAAGLTPRIRRVPSLELDVDTPDDLAELEAHLRSHPRLAPRTQALLRELPVPPVGTLATAIASGVDGR